MRFNVIHRLSCKITFNFHFCSRSHAKCIWMAFSLTWSWFRKTDISRAKHFLNPRSLIGIFAVRLRSLWILGYPQRGMGRLWSDCFDAQAGLSLRWAHMQSSRKYCTSAHILSFLVIELAYSVFTGRKINVLFLQMSFKVSASEIMLSKKQFLSLLEQPRKMVLWVSNTQK